jgi:hypothetical protein
MQDGANGGQFVSATREDVTDQDTSPSTNLPSRRPGDGTITVRISMMLRRSDDHHSAIGAAAPFAQPKILQPRYTFAGLQIGPVSGRAPQRSTFRSSLGGEAQLRQLMQLIRRRHNAIGRRV